MQPDVREISLWSITPNLRFVCDVEVLERLSRSIRSQGQLEPVRIWFYGESFRILDGEKRWRACKRLGMNRLKAVIVPADRDE